MCACVCPFMCACFMCVLAMYVLMCANVYVSMYVFGVSVWCECVLVYVCVRLCVSVCIVQLMIFDLCTLQAFFLPVR